MAEQPIAIRYENTLEDMIAYHLHSLKTIPALREEVNRRRMVRIGWALFVPMAVFYAVAQSMKMQVHPAVFWEVLALSVAGAVWQSVNHPKLMRREVEKQVRGIYTPEGKPSTLTEHLLRPDSEGLHTSSPLGEGRTAWSAGIHFETSPEHVFVYLGPSVAYVIPKERLLEGDLDTFLAEVERRAALPDTGAPGSSVAPPAP